MAQGTVAGQAESVRLSGCYSSHPSILKNACLRLFTGTRTSVFFPPAVNGVFSKSDQPKAVG